MRYEIVKTAGGVVGERDHETLEVHDFTEEGLKDSNIGMRYILMKPLRIHSVNQIRNSTRVGRNEMVDFVI